MRRTILFVLLALNLTTLRSSVWADEPHCRVTGRIMTPSEAPECSRQKPCHRLTVIIADQTDTSQEANWLAWAVCDEDGYFDVNVWLWPGNDLRVYALYLTPLDTEAMSAQFNMFAPKPATAAIVRDDYDPYDVCWDSAKYQGPLKSTDLLPFASLK
jgi:hypothetical protein